MASAPLVATELLIRDFRGCSGEKRIQLGQITILHGANGSGKTTVLDAVQSSIGRISLAEFAHRGGEAPSRPLVQILLEGGQRFVQVERDAHGQGISEWSGDSFVSQPKPGERMLGLVDALACNPIRFDRAKPEDRLKALLLALPVQLDQSRIAEIVAPSGVRPSNIPSGIHALVELDLIHEQVFQARRDVNREQRNEDSIASKLTPAERLGTEPDVAKAEKVFEAARDKAAAFQRGIEQNLREARGQAQRDRDDAIRESQAILEREIEEAKARHTERRVLAEEALAHARNAAQATHDDNLPQLGKLQEEAARAREEKAAREADHLAWQEAATLRKRAAESRAKADALAARSQAMTSVLEALKAYRQELAGSLPAGLELVEGDLHVRLDSGACVPYEQANSALRWKVAAMVAAARAQQLPWPLIVIDDGEKLDHHHRLELLRELSKHPVQVIMAVVDQDETPAPLRVEILDREALAA